MGKRMQLASDIRSSPMPYTFASAPTPPSTTCDPCYPCHPSPRAPVGPHQAAEHLLPRPQLNGLDLGSKTREGRREGGVWLRAREEKNVAGASTPEAGCLW
jgi:hypothetical protein